MISPSAPACLTLPLPTSAPPQVLHLLATSQALPLEARPHPVPASGLWSPRQLSQSRHLLPPSCRPRRLTAKRVRARNETSKWNSVVDYWRPYFKQVEHIVFLFAVLMSAGASVHSTSSSLVNTPASVTQPTSTQATAFVQPTQQQAASQDAGPSMEAERPSTSSSLIGTGEQDLVLNLPRTLKLNTSP